MTDRELTRSAARRLAIIRHAEEVTGNVAMIGEKQNLHRVPGGKRLPFQHWDTAPVPSS